MVRRSIDPRVARGARIALSATIRSKDVSRPPEMWNGVKVMLNIVSPSGEQWPGVSGLHGTLQSGRVSVTGTVPSDATAISVILGLQDATGHAWFEDVRVTLDAIPRKRPATRPTMPGKLDRRTDVSRLRGVMYGPHGKEGDIRDLAKMGGNHIRWQFYYHGATNPQQRLDLAAYDKWLDSTIAEVDRVLPLCEELGVSVLIDLHTAPGGIDRQQHEIFRDPKFQQKLIDVWDKLATHYKDKPAVWGYDLVNEPSEGAVVDGLMDWRTLADTIAKRIRKIDPERAIVVSPGPYGGWDNLAYFEPLDVPGIVYSVHMYEPLSFTHQGVLDGMPRGVSYPGSIDGKRWDKDAIRRALQPVREYQLDYAVPIYVGEFSAIRWAPGDSAANYLRDVIDVCEEYQWDWAYHAWREWHGWNVELGADESNMRPTPEPSDRHRALRAGLEKNRTR
jgi:aryl-phospho-beta-D-glucosidase BglC (GH1 family)